MSIRPHLDALFQADDAAHAAETSFFTEGSDAERVELLAASVAASREQAPRHRLMRLADLCAQVPGPEMADALIDLLDHGDPIVRDAAGRGLVEAGYDRYAEIARAIDRALQSGRRGTAMEALPFVVAEIGEPSALTFLRRFLEHPDADVVASAIEAAAELGDPEAVPLLEPFLDDERVVSLDDEEETTATLGELAAETLEELGFEPEDDDA